MATKLEGGGGEALVAGPLKKKIFCGFPKQLTNNDPDKRTNRNTDMQIADKCINTQKDYRQKYITQLCCKTVKSKDVPKSMTYMTHKITFFRAKLCCSYKFIEELRS